MTLGRKGYGRTTTARPRRITIQRDDTAPSGGSFAPWTTPTTLFGATTIDWRTGGGGMQYMADQPRAENVATIRIRWRGDKTVTPGHRVLYVDGGGVIHKFDIINVNDVDDQHQYWDLSVRETGI